VANATRTGDKTDDPAHAPEDTFRTEDFGELRGRFNPILQRKNQRFRTDKRPHDPGRLGHLPGFDPDQNRIYLSNLARFIGSLHGRYHEIAPGAYHVEPVVSQRLQVIAAGQEVDLLAGLGQPSPKITAHPPCTVYRNPHQRHLNGSNFQDNKPARETSPLAFYDTKFVEKYLECPSRYTGCFKTMLNT
jgi:hypothetical protein